MKFTEKKFTFIKGQLGDGTNVSRSTPVKTLLESKKIIEISCGTWHSMALDSQGRVYAWGYNGEGKQN